EPDQPLPGVVTMKKLALVLLVACGAKPPAPVRLEAPPPPPPGPTDHDSPSPPRPSPADEFLEQCRAPIDQAKREIDALVAVTDKRTIANTLEPYNDISRLLDNAGEWANLTSEVHPDPKVRDAARTCEQEAEKVGSQLMLDRRVFDALHAIDASSG